MFFGWQSFTIPKCVCRILSNVAILIGFDYSNRNHLQDLCRFWYTDSSRRLTMEAATGLKFLQDLSQSREHDWAKTAYFRILIGPRFLPYPGWFRGFYWPIGQDSWPLIGSFGLRSDMLPSVLFVRNGVKSGSLSLKTQLWCCCSPRWGQFVRKAYFMAPSQP